MPRSCISRLECRGPRDSDSLSVPELTEHFFRHEYGKLVATLSRRVGTQRIEDIEDAVQSALLKGLQTWAVSSVPENPTAWLFKVARNNLLERLRQDTRRQEILNSKWESEYFQESNESTARFSDELKDDLLKMLFLCCDDSIPKQSQLILALKTLCGFSIQEIAHRLFSNEPNVYKRLGRARTRLKEQTFSFEEIHNTDARLPEVLHILYLLFTEGYLSIHAEFAIRSELCQEAVRLLTLLTNHPLGNHPDSFALLALMHFHAARMDSRQDASGGLLLLEEQNRELWDLQKIQLALWYLSKSASGDAFSRYHAEAGIAVEHCLAKTYQETRWDRIVQCYELLEKQIPSPLHTLNRAISVAEWKGPEYGLEILKRMEPPTWLKGSYTWSAVLADLHRRAGNKETSLRYSNIALGAAPTQAIRKLLERRLQIVR